MNEEVVLVDVTEDRESFSESLAQLKSTYEIVEAVGIRGQKEDYIYEFKQNGVTVSDLKINTVRDIANRFGFVVVDMKYEETPEAWIVTATAKNPETGATAMGVVHELKETERGNYNRYAFNNAIAKAQRDALRRLIPTAVVTSILKHFGVEN